MIDIVANQLTLLASPEGLVGGLIGVLLIVDTLIPHTEEPKKIDRPKRRSFLSELFK